MHHRQVDDAFCFALILIYTPNPLIYAILITYDGK